MKKIFLALLPLGLLLSISCVAAHAQTTPFHASYLILAGAPPAGMDMTAGVAISPELEEVAAGTVSSSATLTQVVNAAPAVAATVTLSSTPNPSAVGQTITYSGKVTGTNNGASPTGSVTVAGITGTLTATLGAGGTFTCSETPTAPTTGFKVVATYNGDANFF